LFGFLNFWIFEKFLKIDVGELEYPNKLHMIFLTHQNGSSQKKIRSLEKTLCWFFNYRFNIQLCGEIQKGNSWFRSLHFFELYLLADQILTWRLDMCFSNVKEALIIYNHCDRLCSPYLMGSGYILSCRSIVITFFISSRIRKYYDHCTHIHFLRYFLSGSPPMAPLEHSTLPETDFSL